MDIHVCKQCGSHFVYCRKCTFRPVRYKDAGFCSKECYEASKIEIPNKIEIKPIMEEILDVLTEPIMEEVFTEDEISESENEVLTEEVEIEFCEEEVEINEEHE